MNDEPEKKFSIINIIFLLITIVLVVMFIVQQRYINQLDERVSGIEKLLTDENNLQKISETPHAAASINTKKMKEINWRNIRQGMSPSEIRDILGEPDNIYKGENSSSYFYETGRIDGVIYFDRNNKTERWDEPVFQNQSGGL